MKKSITLLALLFPLISLSSEYYKGYPLTVVQTSNAGLFRLECSVYDSSLAQTFTYNTAYYENINSFNNINGVMAYGAYSDQFSYGQTIGALTYDFITHQWKPYIVDDPNDAGSNAFGSTGDGFIFLSYQTCGQGFRFIDGYYDIISHNWMVTDFTYGCGGDPAYTSINDDMLFVTDGDPFPSVQTYQFNPFGHNYPFLTSGTSYGQYNSYMNDGVSLYHSYFSMFGDPDYTQIGTYDPNSLGTGLYYSNTPEASSNSGIIAVRDDDNFLVHIGKYDAQQNLWKTVSFPSSDISSWVIGQGVVALKRLNSMVISGVYNFNLHQWVFDSLPSPAVNSLAINNGTVSWNNGTTTVQRGYNPSTGWANGNTTLQSVFYVENLFGAGSGNLIYVRNYSIGATGWSYNFGDGTIQTGKNLFHLYKIGGTYNYTGATINTNICLTVSNSSGSTSSCQAFGCTSPSSSISATGPTTFCTGGSVTLNETTGASGVSYQWRLNSSAISGATSSSFNASNAGSYTCVVTNACGSSTSNSITVTVNTAPSQPGSISGITQACNPVNNVPFSISPVAGATSYNWYSLNPAVTVNAPNNTTNVTVNLGATTSSTYSLRVEAINACGTSPFSGTSIRRTVSGVTTVTGTNIICAATNGVAYSCNAVGGADSYFWTVPAGATIATGQGTTAITVNFSSAYNGGNICVSSQLNCGFSANPRCYAVAKGTAPVPGNVSGNSTVCPGATGNFSIPALTGVTYNWTVPAGASITAGSGTNAITVQFPSTFSSGNVCVNVTNACGVVSVTKCRSVITAAPSRPASVSGATSGVCNSLQAYTSAASTGATSYLWSVTGGTIQSGQGTQSVTVQWNNTGATGTLNVNGVNACGNGLVRSVAVNLKPASNGSITGNTTACANTSEVYNFTSLNGATNYLWAVNTASGATVGAGQGTTAATINWLTNGGTVYCTPSNACGSSGTKTLAVSITCREAGEELVSDKNSLFNVAAIPNPFNNELNITSTVYGDGVVLKVSDMLGKTISQHLLQTASFKIQTPTLKNGVYFLEVTDGSQKKVIKVVKAE